MRKKKPVYVNDPNANTKEAAKLFKKAHKSVLAILALVKEYNEYALTLEEMKYILPVGDGILIKDPEYEGWHFPHAELVGNGGGNVNIRSADFMDEFWEAGQLREVNAS